jgi:hypothetical protein
MKVVINVKFGGFNLSQKALKILRERRPDLVSDWKSSLGEELYLDNSHKEEIRSDQDVVRIVEELGKEADGRFSKLKVVDIPFETTEGWHLHEYDGWESIEENHRSWS